MTLYFGGYDFEKISCMKQYYRIKINREKQIFLKKQIHNLVYIFK